MPGRCRDCRYWASPDLVRGGLCSLAEEGWEHSTHRVIMAERSPVGHFLIPDYAACSLDGLRCWLVTAPEFGCISFCSQET